MNDIQIEKKKFRNTSVWKKFRDSFKGSKDALTNKRLIKGFNLHHLDIDPNNYKNLIEEHFIPLNKQSHEVVHFLFRYYVTDREILDRLKDILNKMIKLNEKSGK